MFGDDAQHMPQVGCLSTSTQEVRRNAAVIKMTFVNDLPEAQLIVDNIVSDFAVFLLWHQHLDSVALARPVPVELFFAS
jgi:hypothetical protein